MNYIIDFEHFKRINMPPVLGAMFLAGLGEEFESFTDNAKRAIERVKLAKFEDDSYILLKKGRELSEELAINVDKDGVLIKDRASIDEINSIVDERLQEFRDVWRGLKPGSMGDPKACRAKLIKWLDENQDYDMDDVINAAKAYINSMSNYNYLQRADYFIYKQEADKTTSSRLSAYIDESPSGDDWTNKLV